MEHILCSELCQQSHLLCQWETSAWEGGKGPQEPAANGALGGLDDQKLRIGPCRKDARDTAYCSAVKFWGQHHRIEAK